MAETELELRRGALISSPLFQVLQPSEIDAVLGHAVTRRFARNSRILRKGDPGSGMLVVLRGKVRISAPAEDGKDVMLDIAGPGEIIGELSLIDGRERSADIMALEDCVLLVVERTYFLALLRSNVDLCLRLMNVLCERLRQTDLALEEMVSLNLPTRLGRLLLRLARDYGGATADGVRIGVRLSQKDLSALVGASREKVNKQLRHWQQDGIVARVSNYLVILRPEELGKAHAQASAA